MKNQSRHISENKILKIALPSIISNITVPLLGLIDITIVGHLGSSAYIGAISVGGLMFNILYWIFAFLRMGTTGMTSQAYGKRDLDEVVRILVRSLGTGLIISILLILLQYPILQLVLIFVKPSKEVLLFASQYFHILVWGAPAMLCLYGFTGWYIGMQNSRFPMLIAIVQNVVNIICSLCLVYIFKLKIEGVAFGTLIAQYAGLFIALFLWMRYYKRLRPRLRTHGIWKRDAIIRFFTVNRDIFLRTICLVSVTMYFTSAGASQGDIVLAANTLLMQFFILFSYFTDGFANAGEALVGKYIGAQNNESLNKTIKYLFAWGIGIAIVFTSIYFLGGNTFIHLLTNEENVRSTSQKYIWWIFAIPLASIVGFVWDGVFIGATATRQMLISMFCATIAFFVTYTFLRTDFGNNALWLAFVIYLFFRGLIQSLLARTVLQKAIN